MNEKKAGRITVLGAHLPLLQRLPAFENVQAAFFFWLGHSKPTLHLFLPCPTRGGLTTICTRCLFQLLKNVGVAAAVLARTHLHPPCFRQLWPYTNNTHTYTDTGILGLLGSLTTPSAQTCKPSLGTAGCSQQPLRPTSGWHSKPGHRWDPPSWEEIWTCQVLVRAPAKVHIVD